MTFTVQPVNPTNLPKVIALLFDSFTGPLSQPLINAMYPSHDTPKGRAMAVERFAHRNATDPLVTHLMVIDDTTGEPAAQATWFIRDPGMPTPTINLSGPYWSSEDDRAYAEALARAYFSRRFAVFDQHPNVPVFAISAMCTAKKYRGTGAGSAFVEWGLKRADEVGAECVVESALGAEGFYEKHGFVKIEDVVVNEEMEDKGRWVGRDVQRFTWMRRAARKV